MNKFCAQLLEIELIFFPEKVLLRLFTISHVYNINSLEPYCSHN